MQLSSSIEVYETLKESIGDKSAKVLVSWVESKREDVVTKEYMKQYVDTKIEEVKSYVDVKVSEAKADIIKWMFIFWAGNVITILGGMAFLLKLAKAF